jgi:hypothetical protein
MARCVMCRLGVLVTIILATLVANATSCMGPITVCSSFDGSQTVFRGRVIEIVPVYLPPTPVTYPDGSKTTLYAGPGTEHVRLEVLEVFKGNPGSEITVTSPARDMRFEVGSEAIVFASRFGTANEFGAGLCSRTHSLTDAAADADLAWLRAYPTAPERSAIFGSFSLQDHAEARIAATVAISGDESRTAASDDKNSYRFDNLAPGTYKLTASVPAGMVADGARTVTVAAKSCAEVDWYVRFDSHIQGKVTDIAGKPLSGIGVELLRPSNFRGGFTFVTTGVTDANGEYDISKVAPGDYWVALNPLAPDNRSPYTPVYYPAASTLAAAKLLHLTASGSLSGIDLVQPEPLQAAIVHARVIRGDGEPVDQAKVDAVDTRNRNQFIRGVADATGWAELHLYAGREYYFDATTPGEREPVCAGPVRFVAKDGLVLDTLTLDKSFDQCRDYSKLDARPAAKP